MNKALQVKMLRILQSGEYAPVGIAENRYTDVRVVAASNQNVQALVDMGQFRGDLYYRLNIIRLEIPPLRERRGDIPLLLDHFLRVFSTTYRKPDVYVSLEAANMLQHYPYPGNVRELENVIRRGALLCKGNQITTRDLPPEVIHKSRPPSESQPASFHKAKARAIEQFERVFLNSILSDCGGIISRAAHRSGLSERNFHQKLKKYGISGKAFRPSP